MTYRVEVDKDLCISAGKCIDAYPGAFRFDDDELAETIPGLAELSEDDKKAAARACPSGAITLYGHHGEEVDPFSG